MFRIRTAITGPQDQDINDESSSSQQHQQDRGTFSPNNNSSQSQPQAYAGGRTRTRATRYKVIFLGDEGVGKTQLISRISKNEFDEAYNSTIGIDYCPVDVEEYNVKLQLWDMAAHNRFHCLVPSYIADAAAVVIVYDVTRRESFLNASRWAQYVYNNQAASSIVYLVGNKSDLGSSKQMRQVSISEGEETAAREGFQFFESSAKVAYPHPTRIVQEIARALVNKTAAANNSEQTNEVPLHRRDHLAIKHMAGVYGYDNINVSNMVSTPEY
mmetsp:Transcript_22953/g.35354  ORF Transcript_22953/g.35354 Transcript_22953/m.35354 type:complete len:271 (-) Transcript_22953:175-987(-)|eukprot:CAMPEP_0196816672 /NCGR_PEP_ID=MMETSP1362-20130617/56660_1 /TAXON_ID=163516 /ORGANISM="Leptocylindrus danicus, Strain CCMP1856" /LENGTH=270 /DNA_ID=CAMNT_0042194107 /DNA_START=320 /DNA_END=1132 /DNA_ORIENTATION=-